MASTAILIGNAVYQNGNDLDCCANDVAAMKELMEATGKFDRVEVRVDIDANTIRDTIRESLPANEEQSEVFFYFSGHGAQTDGDFYYCGTSFDSRRPNETGVSHSELHGLFRAASPHTLVVVIDACYSGKLLVKNDDSPPSLIKEGFRNVLQFSSSMDNQTSMGGESLSDYTRAFLEASIRKLEGPVYYSDVSNAIRDAFIDDDRQTPYFVHQGSGREILVDDVAKLGQFRKKLAARFEALVVEPDKEESASGTSIAHSMTVTQRLRAAEEKMGSPENTKKLIDELFDGVLEKIKENEFLELYSIEAMEHSQYYEPTVEEFMIRVLYREKRPDELVTAKVDHVRGKNNPFHAASLGLLTAMGQDVKEHFTLELNCSLDRAQIKVVLTPKYRALQQMALVLSCAPSLEKCYIFEVVTRHPRTNWTTFASEGEEVVRRWYKLDWSSSTLWLIDKIFDGLMAAVQDHIDETTERLAAPDPN
ncbi:caspase domain-containing protein [Brucella pseudogrignonensis]|uniref:caspase family protein n=1 Tax=Brucella pseudogrignonensis TaxID=419475 RepID=UPI0038D177B6